MTPVSHDKDSVLQRLPKEWIPLLKKLAVSVDSGVLWYICQISTHFCEPPLVHKLINSLLTQDPVVVDGKLEFVPRFHLLSALQKENFVRFLLNAQTLVPESVCKEFLLGVKNNPTTHMDEDDPLNLLLEEAARLLKISFNVPSNINSNEGGQSSVDLRETIEVKERCRFLNEVIVLEDSDDENMEPETKRQRLDNDPSCLATEEDVNQSKSNNFSCIATDAKIDQSLGNNGSCLDIKENEAISASQQVFSQSQHISLSFVEENDNVEFTDLDGPQALANVFKDWWQNKSSAEESVAEHLHKLNQFSSTDFETFCKEMKFDSMTDDAVEFACRSFCKLSESVSYNKCVCFLAHVLKDRMINLSQNASRKLSGAITQVAKTFPKQFVDSVVAPCMLSEELKTGQGEVMSIVLKDCFTQITRSYALLSLLKSDFPLNESKIPVFQSLLDSGCEISPHDMEKFVSYLKNVAQQFRKNLKFSKLLLALVTKHPDSVKTCLHDFAAILDLHETFLKKKIMASLNKLKE